MPRASEESGRQPGAGVARIWPAANFLIQVNVPYDGVGMDPQIQTQEAPVGDSSLELLAKDLGSNRIVVVEKQLNGVVVAVLQIENSAPARSFQPVVFASDRQKRTRSQTKTSTSSKGEAFRQYFQPPIDELREKHHCTGSRVARPQNWYAFSIGTSGIPTSAVFAWNGTVRVELYIDVGDSDTNKRLFDWLRDTKEALEKDGGFPLNWERLDERRACRISVTRPGSIESSAEDLAEFRKWQIERLLIFKRVFAPLAKAGLKAVSTG